MVGNVVVVSAKTTLRRGSQSNDQDRAPSLRKHNIEVSASNGHSRTVGHSEHCLAHVARAGDGGSRVFPLVVKSGTWKMVSRYAIPGCLHSVPVATAWDIFLLDLVSECIAAHRCVSILGGYGRLLGHF